MLGVLTCMELITSKFIIVSPVDTPFISTKHYLALKELIVSTETGISSFIDEEGKITSINFAMLNYPGKFEEIKELVTFKIANNIKVRMSDIHLSTSISLFQYDSQLHGSFVNINKEPEMDRANQFDRDGFEFENYFLIHPTKSYLSFLKQIASKSSEDIILDFVNKFKSTMLEKQIKNDVNFLLS